MASTTKPQTTPAADEDDFFDEASEAFPSKEDLKDRLVAVWALTRGTDRNTDGKLYPFVTSVTMVLDDGPAGWSPTSIKDGETVPNLVPSVKDHGPQELNLRWSTSGMVSRLDPRIGTKDTPMIGRINSQPNKTKGRSASWSISSPTDEDKVIARQYRDALKATTARLVADRTKAEDQEAFS